MTSINFTKKTINELTIPDRGMEYYKDIKESGLSLYVTAKGKKTFFIRKRINGKDERFIIGSFPEITVDLARKEAMKLKSMVAHGINPNDRKRKLNIESTLEELFVHFMERYSKLQNKTWKQDESKIKKFLNHWFNRKISTIKKEEVSILHNKIRKNNGLYQANRLLSKISVMYNKAIEWGYEGKNPALGIKKFSEKSRDRFLQPDEITRLFKAIAKETNDAARDYILISLFTGARQSNVLSMRWEDLDFKHGIWHIKETKNGEAITIPLIIQALELLKKREEFKISSWVFPSPVNIKKPLNTPHKAWKRILEESGIENLRLHDLRRTLGSYQAIGGTSLHIIGKSLGHKTSRATEIYSRLTINPVKDSMQMAIDSIFESVEDE